MPRLSRGAVRRFSRRAIDAALESRIAEPPATALRDLLALPDFCQVADQLASVDVVNNRAARHHDIKIFTRVARPVLTGSADTALCFEFARHPEVRESIQGSIGNQVNAATVAAVAAIRPASFDVFLATEAQAAVTAIARLYTDRCFIDEFHLSANLRIENEKPRESGAQYSFFARGSIARRGELLLRVDDADELPVLRPLLFELDVAVFLGEQSVVPPDPDVDTGMKTRTALADDDVARNDLLPTVDLYAKAFTL